MSAYKLDEKSLNVLKEITEIVAPSGFEEPVLERIKQYYSEYADEVRRDNLGSLILVKRGSSERPKVLVAGHVDEVGFLVTGITPEGFITFTTLGGWFEQVLLAQRVVIRTKKGEVYGVITSKPPHLLTPEERQKVVQFSQMYIDVGATSKEEVEKLGVRIGDPVAPWSPFTRTAFEDRIMAKALDDRVGAFIAMEVLKHLRLNGIDHPNTLYAAATVQEEVGLRGAETVGWVADHDVAIVTEVDIAGDVPGIKPSEAPAKLGKGPSIIVYDRSMIPNPRFKEFVIEVAEEAKIPYQLSAVSGGTDAGRLHLYKGGRPSIVIGVPTRHIHSHVSIVSLSDVENAVRLVLELVKRLDQETLKRFVNI
ncbi:M42 family metallopeptidase [Thermofilum pendens]|uniref:Cellulase n=1 Tax=Thermofilum pendens (strain DSM 2475 / Hrk 5) TaxID=368408 RepID=A1RW32_THEPD|nr:M42 family metallopeptidase [Thermofilum pendens]ABL77412.1 Cellulase [Thermofilum pendens Hrk 5]